MILQNEFQKSGYTDLLVGDSASKYGINLDEIFDSDKKPKELMGIYMSEPGDELYFLLNGDSMKIDKLCAEWDQKLRIFTLINERTAAIRKLKYNMVQLIVYSQNKPDRTIESNLQISRKIIIKGNMTREHIEITDAMGIELPFYMISANEFAPDVKQTQRLIQLLPKDEELFTILRKEREKVNRNHRADIQPKHYTQQEFDKIEEWLRR